MGFGGWGCEQYGGADMAGLTKRSGASGASGWSRFLFALSICFLAFGLASLGWVMWPSGRDSVQMTIPSGVLPGASAGTDYAALMDYTLTITWPRMVRLGRTGEIELILVGDLLGEAGENKDRPAALQTILMEPVLPGMPLAPPGLVQVNMAEGQTLDQVWTLTPIEAGDYAGKLYLSFGFYDQQMKELVTVPVAVVDFSLQVAALWGLEANLVLWLGLVGLVLWGALFVLGRFVHHV